ncbi:NANOG neighbor homeobox [Peromyscus eremicus]|uniref:NANOG neighbor homeobox n=1 Tax=Peromyscus eremicus TaxID=42410 RepID=UPI0027DBBA5B|nr:NANOG neighbor homeobox [Peromyscus eremicus]
MKQSLDIKNVTTSERSLFKKKQQITHHGRQDPGHSSWSSSKGGWKRKTEKRKKPEAKLKKRVKQQKKPRPKKSVSKPLMATLWARFKSRLLPTAKDCHLLSFQFSLTDKQIFQWFWEKRKKYKEERKTQPAAEQNKQDPGDADPLC